MHTDKLSDEVTIFSLTIFVQTDHLFLVLIGPLFVSCNLCIVLQRDNTLSSCTEFYFFRDSVFYIFNVMGFFYRILQKLALLKANLEAMFPKVTVMVIIIILACSQ